MTSTRHPLDYTAQCAADFAALRALVGSVLESEHGIPEAQLERVQDISASLARAAPALPGDVAMLVALGQDQAARELVAAGLQTLKKIDPYLFADAPSPRRMALLKIRALPNCDDWESAVTNSTLDTSDQRRRTWGVLCRRMEAEGRASKIPTEEEARNIPPSFIGMDGVRASRVNFPRRRKPIDGEFAWEPPQ